MPHRNTDDRSFTLAAIDDLIDRGRLKDWLELRDAVTADAEIAARTRRIVDAHSYERNQRYSFWRVFLGAKPENAEEPAA